MVEDTAVSGVNLLYPIYIGASTISTKIGTTSLDEWEIKVGECIPSKIDHAIGEADYVIIVLSPDAVESGWVEREWQSKYWDEIEQNKIFVLPVLLKDCKIPNY